MRGKSAIVTGLCLVLAASAAPAQVDARTSDAPRTCAPIDAKRVKALFTEWDKALQDETATKVVAMYADDATLLPTVENGPYTKADGSIKNYFVHFVELKPVATIDETKRFIKIGCNVAYDIGLYTFEVNGEHTTNRETIRARYTFIYQWDGKRWLIAHHHSSRAPVEPN
jgi:uncharacterized protein (TIGR02246 family)